MPFKTLKTNSPHTLGQRQVPQCGEYEALVLTNQLLQTLHSSTSINTVIQCFINIMILKKRSLYIYIYMDIVYFVFKCCQSAHPKSALSWRSSWLQAALPPRGTPKDSPSAHGCAPRNLENFLRPKVELQSSRARAKYRGLNCLGFHHHDIS